MILNNSIRKTFEDINSIFENNHIFKITNLYELINLEPYKNIFSNIYHLLLDIFINKINSNDIMVVDKENFINLISDSKLDTLSFGSKYEIYKICIILQSDLSFIDKSILEPEILIFYIGLKVISLYINIIYNSSNINLGHNELDLIHFNLANIFAQTNIHSNIQTNIFDILQYNYYSNRIYFDLITDYILYQSYYIESVKTCPMDID